MSDEAQCFGAQERFQVRYIERESHLLIRWGRSVYGGYGATAPIVLTDLDRRILKYWGLA